MQEKPNKVLFSCTWFSQLYLKENFTTFSIYRKQTNKQKKKSLFLHLRFSFDCSSHHLLSTVFLQQCMRNEESVSQPSFNSSAQAGTITTTVTFLSSLIPTHKLTAIPPPPLPCSRGTLGPPPCPLQLGKASVWPRLISTQNLSDLGSELPHAGSQPAKHPLPTRLGEKLQKATAPIFSLLLNISGCLPISTEWVPCAASPPTARVSPHVRSHLHVHD